MNDPPCGRPLPLQRLKRSDLKQLTMAQRGELMASLDQAARALDGESGDERNSSLAGGHRSGAGAAGGGVPAGQRSRGGDCTVASAAPPHQQ